MNGQTGGAREPGPPPTDSREAARGGRRAPGARPEPSRRGGLLLSALLLVTFWTLAVVLWRVKGQAFWLLNFGWIGTSLGIGTGLFVLLPRRQRVWGRRLAQALIGSYMLGFLGLYEHENMQLEGFFILLAQGVVSGAVIHFLVAKIFGPLLFGRGWCGWACWTAAVLDVLPFDRPKGRVHRRWEWGRYAMLAASVAAVVVALRMGSGEGGMGRTALAWLLVGNAVYYAAAIALAFALRDNRAFCKYLCPIAVPMKVGARLSWMKVGGEGAACDGCGACDRSCPMNVQISAYLRAGTRVLSTECIQCRLCVSRCPQHIPQITLGLDVGGRELLTRGASRR